MALCQAGRWLQELEASSCSPCGTYICTFAKGTADMQVKDTRSGEVMLRRTLKPTLDAQFQGRMFHDAGACWSTCGCRLMLLICTSSLKSPEFFCEQLVILHFC